MKNALLILIISLIFSPLSAQLITAINYTPLTPTTTDTIYFYVELTFPNSACLKVGSSFNVVGSTVEANAVHCVGMLAAICNITDTFMVLPLPAGNYLFEMTLNSGTGGPPCIVGFNPDDTRTDGFTVSTITGLSQEIFKNKIEIAPNPSLGKFQLSNLGYSEVIVYDVLGSELINLKGLNKTYVIDLSNYPQGIYLLKSTNNGVITSYRLIRE